MTSVLLAILPIFGLIGVGWLARRLGVLGPAASSELNRFVVQLSLPALLFQIVATARWLDVWQPHFIAAFGLGVLIIFGGVILIARLRGRPLTDATLLGLNGGYANTAFLGFPIASATLGSQALTPVLIATILTVCLLFAIAVMLIEIGQQSQQHPHRLILKALGAMARNPLLVAPTLGAVCLALNLKPPAPAETFLKLLGGAASPCALLALGLFIAEPRPTQERTAGLAAGLVALKLLAQPLVTWVLAAHVFGLTPVATRAAVLIAALPTGTGPFMAAEFYGRGAALTARVILVSTALSLVTMTAYLIWSR